VRRQGCAQGGVCMLRTAFAVLAGWPEYCDSVAALGRADRGRYSASARNDGAIPALTKV